MLDAVEECKRIHDVIMEKLKNGIEQYVIKCQSNVCYNGYRFNFSRNILVQRRKRFLWVERVRKHLMKNTGIKESNCITK